MAYTVKWPVVTATELKSIYDGAMKRCVESSVCFTGHRNIPPDELLAVRLELTLTIKELLSKGFYNFVTGGALGFDTLVAEVALELREIYTQLRLIVVAPYAGQSSGWTESERMRYRSIINAADDYVCLQQGFSRDCMKLRNQQMVDMSSVCVAYLKRSRSGTAQTVRMAQIQNKKVINIAETSRAWRHIRRIVTKDSDDRTW